MARVIPFAEPWQPTTSLQQPDFHQLNILLAGVVEQIALIPNMPAVVGIEALINNLQEQQAERHQEIIQRLDALQAGWVSTHRVLVCDLRLLNQFFCSQGRLPMQLKNAIASLESSGKRHFRNLT